jgi:hypothetical protein
MPNSTIHPGLYFGPKPNGGAGHGLTGLPIPWSLLAHAGAVDALSAVTVRGRGQSAHRGAVAIGSSTVESQRKLRGNHHGGTCHSLLHGTREGMARKGFLTGEAVGVAA